MASDPIPVVPEAAASMSRQRRRRHILILGTALVVVPVVVEGQRGEKVRRIGFLSPSGRGPRNDACLQGLRELGYIEGRNVVVEMRFAEGRPEDLPGLVQELIRLKSEVLVVGATIGARAAKNATTSIPVVFAGSSDPVAGGIVMNLARPEANITGFSLAIGEGFAGKWLELLKEAAPNVSHCAVIWSSSNKAATRFVKELQAAARGLQVSLEVHDATNLSELDQAIAAIAHSGAHGLIVTPSPFSAANKDKFIQFAASRRLPAIYFDEDFADAGGLMSYGPNIVETYRQAARHVDKILKGAQPGSLPVEQATRFSLVVNLKTARTLGLQLPQSVRLRADRVIE